MMDKTSRTKFAISCCLLAVAGVMVYRFIRDNRGAAEKAFFYDVSQKRLFTAARTAVPPIRGVDGPEEDAFRAVVISTNATPEDKASWKIVYLERYSPELKQQMQSAQAGGAPPGMGRMMAPRFRAERIAVPPSIAPP